MTDGDWPLSRTKAAYVVVAALVVVLAVVLAPVAWNIGATDSQNDSSVSVITLRGGTTDSNINAVTESLREAKESESTEAVVIRIDSPGGPVDSSEEFYLAVNRTAAEMPVVAYVEGTAASGGYYGIAPADRIYVKPSSTVGSIGVTVQAPISAIEEAEQQTQSSVRSGPDKAQIDRDQIRQNIEELQRSFVGTVVRHRGDELTLNRQGVASGQTYLGATAVQNGFADEIGDLNAAIEYAATQSEDIDGDQYNVEYQQQSSEITLQLQASEVESVDGNIIYLKESDSQQTEFVRPVRYYTVWGVPVGNTTVRGEAE